MDAIYNIFKAYDVRGKVGSELTPAVANGIGKAFADWLPTEGTIVVGRDMRPDSGELAQSVIEGLRGQGRDVIDIGEVTTDMIYFAVGQLKLAGGMVVTASHNPGEYNGIKICREEARPVGLESGLDQIRDSVLGETYKAAAAQPGSLTQQDITEEWVQHALTFIDAEKLKPMKLAVDAGNGMAGKIFPELEPYVPWEVSEMYFELDGTFPNHEANPMKFETLADLIENIKANKLDGGIAFDGDGDRAFLVDETGEVLPGSVMCGLLAEYFLGLKAGSSIVYDVRVSRGVPKIVAELGGKPVISPVGGAYIRSTMRELDAPFGGEASGHFYFGDNWCADSGLISAVIGLYVATITGMKLSQVREKYTLYAAIPETNFIVEDKEAALQRIKTTFKDNEQDALDGLSVTIDENTWFNVRSSNTEPVLRLNAEAKDDAQLEQLVQRVTSLITDENS